MKRRKKKMNINGWTKNDIRQFEDLMTKANSMNLRQAEILLNAEIDNREKALQVKNAYNNFRGVR